MNDLHLDGQQITWYTLHRSKVALDNLPSHFSNQNLTLDFSLAL